MKRERGDPQAQLEAMQGFLERSGLKVRGVLVAVPVPPPPIPAAVLPCSALAAAGVSRGG